MSELILIVEDEPKLAALLKDYLEQADFRTAWFADGSAAAAAIPTLRPALILLDLMLPGKDGLTLCREVRGYSQVPIIMLTARIDEIDRLLGLELGADDYVCKPFSPREVVARVKAVLRRGQPTAATTPLRLDIGGYRAFWQGQDLELTAVEFNLLALLAGQPGRIFTRQQLMDHIYPDQRVVCDRTIDSHIKKLRRKLQRHDQNAEPIHSLYGVGYKFEV